MKKYIIYLTASITLVMIGFWACKTDITDNININFNTAIYKSPTLIRFVNANTSSTVQPGNFSVVITGKDAGKVVMETGGTNFKTIDGFLQLALLKNVSPTIENPITFNVSVAEESFAPISQTIIITDTTSRTKIIPMIEYANPAEGTSSAISTTSLNNGVAGLQKIVTPTTGSVSETTTITIPQGTVMKDVSGNTINTSSLKTSVVYFNAVSPTSLSAFPGGLSPSNIIGITGGGDFITVGLVSVKMNAGGTEVKKFSSPINVNMQVNAGLTNPVTNNPYVKGDTIPIWSMDDATGQWKYESTGTMALDNTNKLYVSFAASHLSSWNLDFIRSGSSCNNPLKYTIQTNDGSTIPTGSYSIVLGTSNYAPKFKNGYWEYYGNGYFGKGLYSSSIYDGYTDLIYRVPAMSPVQIWVLDERNGTSFKSGNISPCSGTNNIINVTRNLPPVITVNISATAKCNTQSVTAQLNGWVYLRKQSSRWYDWQYVYVKNGQATFQLEDGASYYVQAIDASNGRWVSTVGTFSSTMTGTFSDNGLSATGSYDATKKVYSLTLTKKVDCN